MNENIKYLLDRIILKAYHESDALKAIKLKVLHDDIMEKFKNNYEDALNYYNDTIDIINGGY